MGDCVWRLDLLPSYAGIPAKKSFIIFGFLNRTDCEQRRKAQAVQTVPLPSDGCSIIWSEAVEVPLPGGFASMRGLVCSGVTEGGTYSIVLVFDKGSRFDRRLSFFFIGQSNLILFRLLSIECEKKSLG